VPSPAQPSQSHAVSEELFTQNLSSQDSSNFENTATGTRESYNSCHNSGDMGNPLEKLWMADVDPSTMLDRFDWSQFAGTDPDPDIPF